MHSRVSYLCLPVLADLIPASRTWKCGRRALVQRYVNLKDPLWGSSKKIGKLRRWVTRRTSNAEEIECRDDSMFRPSWLLGMLLVVVQVDWADVRKCSLARVQQCERKRNALDASCHVIWPYNCGGIWLHRASNNMSCTEYGYHRAYRKRKARKFPRGAKTPLGHLSWAF